MNTQHYAQSGYGAATTPIRTTRGTEYEAFARITRNLSAAIRNRKATPAALAEAIHANRRLWTLLAADVASEDNGLPEALRARIFYLSEFTSIHSSRVLNKDDDPGVLVEINTAVMQGLRQKVEPQ